MRSECRVRLQPPERGPGKDQELRPLPLDRGEPRNGPGAIAGSPVSSGAVEVAIHGERIRLGPGELFGEMALLTGGRRTADVTAIDYCELLMIQEREFRQFAERCPELHAEIDEVASRRDEEHRQRSPRFRDSG